MAVLGSKSLTKPSRAGPSTQHRVDQSGRVDDQSHVVCKSAPLCRKVFDDRSPAQIATWYSSQDRLQCVDRFLFGRTPC